MSDLDENLTSILSSLIDTAGIDTSHSVELVDNNGLDFGNLANCITGNDASLHQTSDENVSSLLESHLNDLTRISTASIVDTTADHLHDITAFDLDKPIHSLLDTTPSEFISHATCIDHKTTALSDVTNDLMSPLHSHALNDLEHVQSVLDACNHHVVEICSDFIPTDLVQHSFSTQSYQLTDRSMTISLDGIVLNGELQENIEADDIVSDVNQCNQQCSEEAVCEVPHNGEDETIESREQEEAEREEEERPQGEGKNRETIEVDQIVDDSLTTRVNSNGENKIRRRILVYGDGISDNSELEEEREKLPQSKSPTPQRQIEFIENQNEPSTTEYSSPTGDDQPNHIDNNTEIDGDNEDVEQADTDVDNNVSYIRDLNEKPGPKSKKQSTYLYNALKAKALLESAIVIPARKRKKRVIESDDEFNESALNQPIDSIDDIGLISEDNHSMPSNVTIETEQKLMFVSEKRPFEARSKISRIKDGIGNSGKDSLSRSTTQAKMEKYHANNNRRSRKKKESKDYFDMPLNAPYVGTSSDEDYFVPHDTNKKNSHNNSHSHHWHKNSNGSSNHQRKKKGHIPDEIYFNATVPLHVLYSYDDSSSDEKRKERSRKSLFSSSTRTLNKMPPVHKIIPRSSHKKRSSLMHQIITKQSDRGIKIPKTVTKPTVFEQLDKLKRLLRASGIKVNINELLKGSKTFQERCERIRNTLHSNGIEGEPTMAKCKQLKKQLKLREEIAGLDPSVIIESKDDDDGRPKRTTRTATRRNYVYDKIGETKTTDQSSNGNDGAALELLQKMREYIDSDSEYEADENSPNGNNNNNNNSNSDSVDFSNATETTIISNGQNGISESSSIHEHDNELSSTENSSQLTSDSQSAPASESEPAQCTISY